MMHTRIRSISAAGIIAIAAAACSSSSTHAASTTTRRPTTTSVARSTTSAATASPSTTSAPISTGTTTASTMPPVGSSGPQRCSTTSGPANYDPQNGFYSVAPKTVDAGAGTLRYDVVQFLIGKDAVTAYQQDNPGQTDGPPNDYWVRNVSPQIYQSHVAPNVVVYQTKDPGNPALYVDTLAHFESRITSHYGSGGVYAGDLYWLRLSGGSITELCEQWVP